MTDIKWPPARLPPLGNELIPAIQGGKMVGIPASSFTSGGGGGGGGGSTIVVSTYAMFRATAPAVGTTSFVLNDPWKGGLFVPGPPNTDNGGTRINDANGATWYRVYDERINAAWFYNAPPNPTTGAPTTLGSGPTTITSVDAAANPQWIGLSDDGGTGVQTAQPYPIGTYWDFVALQEWIYACAADRSVPQSTFVGSMAGGQLTITQWLTGVQYLVPGQAIIGPNVAAGTIVTATTANPNVYWTGSTHNTGGLNITTNRGTAFRGWVEGTILTSSGSAFAGPPLQAGDQIIDPLYPPNSFYNGVLPGTVVGPQIDGPPGGALGSQADWYIGIAQTVASQTMTGVGGPQWNTVGGARNLNVPGYVPHGFMYLNQMLVCNGNGLDFLFASRLGTVLNWYGNATGTSKVGPGLKFNTLAYSTVRGLNMQDQSGGVTNYLVSLSHTPTAPGLNVQNNSFHDWFIGGNYATSNTGVAISPEGGAAQGDTQVFVLPIVAGFNIGISWGGANAIAGTVLGGQTLACPLYGVAAFGGSFSTYTMLAEDSITSYYATPQRTQVHLGGADFYASQVATESCVVIGCRSESVVGMTDFSHESSVMNWTCGGYFMQWTPNQHWTPGTMLQVSNPVGNYGLVMIADDGGPPWMQSDATSTTTVLHFTPSPGWTVNQWQNFGIWLEQGHNASSNVVASNTANTITLAQAVSATGANWWKLFSQSGAVAPNWGAVTNFGQFQRNATGWGVTIAAGFNLFSTTTGITAGTWVMVPGFAVFPDGSGITQALWGVAALQHPAASNFYIQTVGTLANVWGSPTNPILLGSSPSGIGYNFLIAQTSGTAGQAGAYTLLYNSNLGASFTGSVNGNQLTVTAVQGAGTIYAGQSLGGAGISSNPAPTIINSGAGINGYIDDGTGGTNPGTTLTVTSIANGQVVLGAPLSSTSANISAGTVVLSQLTGTPNGVGTYSVNPTQLSPHCAFTGSFATTGIMNVTAVASGVLQNGQLIFGPGVPVGMRINNQASGATGGIGTYNVNIDVNLASQSLTAAWPMSVGGQAAVFTGHIDNGSGGAGNQLTVTAMASGVLGIGQTINVPLSGGPAGLTQQVTINAAISGTGGTGTYVLSGGALSVPSSTMTANTGSGIGVYGLNVSLGTILSQTMFSGYASSTQPLWDLQDGHGNKVNSALTGVDQFGYYSVGIPDVSGGGLTYMVIDFDIFWGVGAMDQCQLPFGKVGAIGRMDNAGLPPGGLAGQFIRPGEGFLQQFSFENAVTYTVPPRFGVTINTTPFTIGVSYFAQANVYASVYQNTTLGLAKLGPGMIVDIDLWLTPTGPGMVITWDTTTVRAATPTLTLGAANQNTLVRMKWTGSGTPTGSAGTWWVMNTQGPM